MTSLRHSVSNESLKVDQLSTHSSNNNDSKHSDSNITPAQVNEEEEDSNDNDNHSEINSTSNNSHLSTEANNITPLPLQDNDDQHSDIDSISNNSHLSTQAIEECIILEEDNNETKLTERRIPLTIESLAEQNELFERKKDSLSPRPNAIRAWAAELPEVPDSVQPILTSSHVFEMETPPPAFTDDDALTKQNENEPRIQETKDVFTETQKVAYVSLCYLTSLEVVHDLEGKDFAMARMSADNWQRKLMRMLYAHMDISAEGELKKNDTSLFFFF
jgi:hypothetical protein